MARKGKHGRGADGHTRWLSSETLRGSAAIILFALALLFTLASVGRAGVAGEKIYGILSELLGVGFVLLPPALLLIGIFALRARSNPFPKMRGVAVVLFLAFWLGTVDILFPARGGLLGELIAAPFVALFDVAASLILFGALAIIVLLIIFNARLSLEPLVALLRALKLKKKEPKISGLPFETVPPPGKTSEDEREEKKDGGASEAARDERKEADRERAAGALPLSKAISSSTFLMRRGTPAGAYAPPPLALLEYDKGKPGVGDIKANANIIKRTLLNFGIEVEMDEVSIGPAVTRYALKPAEGVKLSRIVALQNDLALALAAHPLRIEAPIPGKSLVGIEIPNNSKATVGLATMLSSEEFNASDKPLFISLGKDLGGRAHFANLSKMPHLLVGGATGSGKSVTVHTIITSLLFRNSPDDLRFILIDPKRVELTLYNKIPHLATPVITESKKAILALKWAAKEMDRRYDILESESVRDIHSYHASVVAPELQRAAKKRDGEGAAALERMPYLVIIIDELADIMSTYPRELEAAIVRLAQMSRAVGIHLVLSTQRPSVNVITGLIKANIPARIAMQVSSQVDSRTILDTGGAEKLLGGGDMLFLSGEMSKPVRMQSAFVSEQEVKKVAHYLAREYRDEAVPELDLAPEPFAEKGGGNGFVDDEEVNDALYEAAREAVLSAKKASTSYLQRKFRIGYSRAARIMDMLEERGVIGPAEGSKPRAVIGENAPTEEVGEEDTPKASAF